MSKFHNPVEKEKKIIKLKKAIKLKKRSNILPLGSCFLDEFCFHLQQKNFKICSNKNDNPTITCERPSREKALNFFYGNYYNPMNLLNNLERIVKKSWKINDKDYVDSKEFGHIINLFTKTRFKTTKLKELKNKIYDNDLKLLKEIKKASTILLCFDSAQVWISKRNNKAWYTFYGNFFNQKIYKNNAKLKVLSAEEIKKVILRIINILNSVGSKKKIILISSPHPLISTYSNKDHQISNWYDKSTFISAYNELINKNTFYFPLNEIISNYNEKYVYEKNFFYLKPKFKREILVPLFEKIYF